MKDVIIFVHGLNSNCQTDKFLAIDSDNKLCSNVDHSKPEEVENTLTKMIEDNREKNIILVGHSIGAFWARKLAKEYNLKALLLNPSFVPSESARKEIGSAVEYYERNLDPFRPAKGTLYAVLELGDERVDQAANAALLKREARVQTLPGGYHRFSRVAEINSYIAALQNNFT